MRLRLVQLPRIVVSLPGRRRLCHKVIRNILAVDEVRVVVADVVIAAVRDRSDKVIALIHAAPEAEHVLRLLLLMLAGEGVTLHPCRGLDPGQAQEGRREVDKIHHAVALAAGLVFLRRQVLPFGREEHDHRNRKAGVVGPALAPRQARAMIAVVKYDRFPGEPGLVELGQVVSRNLIGPGNNVVVLGPVLA